MTDLPADPRILNDLPGGDAYVPPRATGRSSNARSGEVPPKPMKVVPTEPDPAPAAEQPATPVVYDSLAALAPRTSVRSFVGPLLGVALVGVGLGFLLARTAGTSDANKTARTVVTPPPRLVPTTGAAPAVLGTNVQPTTGAATTATATTAPATTPAPPAPTPATGPPVTPAPPPAPATTPPVAVAPPADSSGVDLATPVRYAEFSRGKVYLHGRVPTAELAATLVAKVAAVVGPANVFSDYVIDPTTPPVAGGPLKVLDTVQFESDSVVLRPEFAQILELGVILMNQNPAVTITVVGRSDGRGSASYNRDLSNRRAGAVVQYWVSRGIDSDRLTIDARGAEDPLAPGDDDASNQANRSVEFIVLGLID